MVMKLGNIKSAENKGLECIIAYNNIQSRFFYINFHFVQNLYFLSHSHFSQETIPGLSPF